ncbi:hypothetical protein E4U43_000952, partial [Claviceps pusilla]
FELNQVCWTVTPENTRSVVASCPPLEMRDEYCHLLPPECHGSCQLPVASVAVEIERSGLGYGAPFVAPFLEEIPLPGGKSEISEKVKNQPVVAGL